MNLTDSYDKPQPILLDPNWLNNFNAWNKPQTVIENVFGDTPTWDGSGWSISPADAGRNAYQRFDSLNPPAVLPQFPDLLGGLKNGLLGTLLVVFLGLFVFLKITK
jgi:hypothetical protein